MSKLKRTKEKERKYVRCFFCGRVAGYLDNTPRIKGKKGKPRYFCNDCVKSWMSRNIDPVGSDRIPQSYYQPLFIGEPNATDRERANRAEGSLPEGQRDPRGEI